MKLLGKDPVTNSVKLRLDSFDDLWTIHQVATAGDVLVGDTTRTAETAQDKLRTEKAPKVRMTLGVKIEQVEWHPFDDHLRVLGPIVEGNQDLGKYHTLALDGDSRQIITIRKQNPWSKWELNLLSKAESESGTPQGLLLCIDDEEAQFATVGTYGVRYLGTIPSGGLGKRFGDSTKAKKEYYDNVIKLLGTHRGEANGPFLIVGPGWWREEFIARGKESAPKLFAGVKQEGVSQGGRTGVQEAVKRGFVQLVLQDHRIQHETAWVEEVMLGLSKSQKTAIGKIETRKAVEMGAAERVLIGETSITDPETRALLQLCADSKCDAHIVSRHHDAGKQLEALGGIAAMLRFELE